MTVSAITPDLRPYTAPDLTFSILIPSWNNLEYLKLCIGSIRRNSTFRHQILVHLNEGTDGSLEWIKEQPDITYTYSKNNLGVCYPLNLLSVKTATDYIVYMNDDMYVCPEWDKALMDEIKRIGHKYFFLSATAIEASPKKACAIHRNFGKNSSEFDEQSLLRHYKSLNIPDWHGATWPPNIVHKDIWQLVGGYSIEFSPGMYSDPDFSMKLWEAGVRLFKGINSSKVYHFGSISVNRVKKNRGYYKFIGKWGFTSSTATQYFLHRGETYDGPLTSPEIPWRIRIKNYLRRLQTSFYYPG
ncbi:MAG: family 2 glycosyl transferase [Cytophagaceae bacterium SCN 52-12]|nr:MAG: family 2 glycosyl transferase [Cytophagaceae bacterium SCN 52-12]